MTLLQVMADTDADEVRLRTDDARLIGDELATRESFSIADRLRLTSTSAGPPERISGRLR